MSPKKRTERQHLSNRRSQDRVWVCFLQCSLLIVLQPFYGFAQENPRVSQSSVPCSPAERSGERDFDFEIGTWRTDLRRLLGQPTIGEIKNGRGEFFNEETLNGRAILFRFAISLITADSSRFEQAFSDDGGKTREVNWIATDTRVKDESGKAR